MIEVEGGPRAAAPKGSIAYAFTQMRNFLLLHLLLAIRIWAFGLRLRPLGWDLGLRVGIWALRLGYGSQVLYLRLEVGFWAIEAEIWPIKVGDWASRLNLNQVRGGRVTQWEEEEEEEEEKIPHVYEKLCSLTCSLKSACLNMSKDIYLFITFKIRKKD